MVSPNMLKLSIRDRVKAMLKAGGRKGLDFDGLVALLCLDTGFKEMTVLKILEQMEAVGECVCDVSANWIKKK